MTTRIHTFVTTGLVALTIAGTAFATASQAEARNNFGRGLVAGLAGAVVGGALLANSHHAPVYGVPAYGAVPYGPPPMAYGPPLPVAHYPTCHVVWQQNAWGDMYRARVCD